MNENALPGQNDEMSESQLQKLKLEIMSLEWNARWGRFTTLITVSITVATLIAAAVGWGYDRYKERDLRSRELRQQTDNRYNSDLAQLLRFPTEESQTIPEVILLFDDLSNLIATAYGERGQGERGMKVGILISELVKSSEFDLTKPRNVEFDKAALAFCPFYLEALINNPKFTKVILQKYAVALEPFHRENINFTYVRKEPGPEGAYVLTKPSDKFEKEGFTPKLRTFATMVNAYEKHIELLNKSIGRDPANAETLKKDRESAFCSFYTSTQNTLLTKTVFQINDEELNANLPLCFH